MALQNTNFSFAETPLVSVVTPAYNEEEYLPQNLESVKSQSYGNIEHIVIDDGSTDSTPDILAEYESQYDLRWQSQSNQGLSNAVNAGFETASGEIIIWLNADDVLCKTNSVSQIVNEFLENQDVQILYGPMLRIGSGNQIMGVSVPFPWFSFSRLKRRYFGSFIFYRRDIIESYKLDTEFQHAPDYEYCLRIADNGGNFKYIDDIIFAHRVHEDRKTDRFSDEMREEGRRCQREYGQKFGYTYKLTRKLDLIGRNALKLYGLAHLREICSDSSNLAFELKTDSGNNCYKRQLKNLPYVGQILR